MSLSILLTKEGRHVQRTDDLNLDRVSNIHHDSYCHLKVDGPAGGLNPRPPARQTGSLSTKLTGL